MNVVISCHFDTVFRDPYARVINGTLIGACDNIAGVLAVAQLIGEPNLEVEFTEDEEMHMDGARYVAKKHSADDTFLLVIDVTNRGRNWNKTHFTVENWFGIRTALLRKALKPFAGKYKMTEHGAESEAWLYRAQGFACAEIDVPVAGGLHSLEGKARVEDILVASQAIKTLAEYIRGCNREDICDPYKVGAET